MGKEDIGMEPEDHDEKLKQDQEVASSIDNEEKDAKDIHEETEEEEKTLDWEEIRITFKKSFGSEVYNSWLQKITLVKEYNDYLILTYKNYDLIIV